MVLALQGYLILIGLIVFGGGIFKLIKKLTGNYQYTPKAVQLEEFVSIPMLAIGVVGCYGYLSNVDIGNSLFWKVYLFLIFTLFIAQFWLPKWGYIKKELPAKFYFPASIINIIIYIPFFYMLVSYAFFTKINE
jgi:hypothetical protein